MSEPSDPHTSAAGWRNWAGDQRLRAGCPRAPGLDRGGLGDRVYVRHAKAGELCERFSSLHLLEGERIVEEVPTYRGEGQCFL
jgi:hypothetical protein